MKKQIILVTIIALLTIIADQATKRWAQTTLRPEPGVHRARVMTIVPGYLDFEYYENRGVTFGIGQNLPGARYIFIGVGFIALIAVWFMIRRVGRGQTGGVVGFALIIGGAIGNQIDRIFHGRVTDFILMHWQRRAVWPAYNVADAALVAGVALLLLTLGRKQEPAAGRKKARRRS